MDRIKSYIAKVSAYSGVLIGGVPSVTSCRFETFKQAVHWSDQCIAHNKFADRDPIFDGIRGSLLDPEILADGSVSRV